MRPLYASTAKDNLASLRILEKCGLRVTGEGRGFAKDRGEHTEEFTIKLP